MTITYTLPGFVDGQQRTEQTSDGAPPEDGNLDCVSRSIADGLTFLTGRNYNGDELKDAVHGQGWTGFQAASEYVGYCRAAGVALTPVNGTPDALVARIHQEIAAGHPVVATIPSMWGLGRDGARAYCAAHSRPYTTHVVCFCGTGPGALRAANPWIPNWHDGGDAYWAADLEEGQIWVMSKIVEVTQHMAWTKNADKTGTDAAGHHCGEGFINDLIATGLAQHDGRLSETYVSGAQTFRSFLPLTEGTVLVYDGAKVTHDGALVAAELYRLLAAAQNKPAPAPAPAPTDPKAQAAENIVGAFGSMLDAVAAYRKL